MKRDLGLIRDILLYIESESSASVEFEHLMVIMESIRTDKIILQEHLIILKEANYLEFSTLEIESGDIEITDSIRITWSGYDFLDSIRDSSIFKKVLSQLSSLEGYPLQIVKELGLSLIKTQLGLTV